MKRFNISLLFSHMLLSCLLLPLDGCRQDNSPEPTGVIGTWKLDAITFNPGLSRYNETITDYIAVAKSYGDKCQDDFRVIFNADGTTTTNYAASCTTTDSFIGPKLSSYFNKAKWAIVGTKLVITYADTTTETFDYSRNSTVLKLAQTADFNNNGKAITLTIQLSQAN